MGRDSFWKGMFIFLLTLGMAFASILLLLRIAACFFPDEVDGIPEQTGNYIMTLLVYALIQQGFIIILPDSKVDEKKENLAHHFEKDFSFLKDSEDLVYLEKVKSDQFSQATNKNEDNVQREINSVNKNNSGSLVPTKLTQEQQEQIDRWAASRQSLESMGGNRQRQESKNAEADASLDHELKKTVNSGGQLESSVKPDSIEDGSAFVPHNRVLESYLFKPKEELVRLLDVYTKDSYSIDKFHNPNSFEISFSVANYTDKSKGRSIFTLFSDQGICPDYMICDQINEIAYPKVYYSSENNFEFIKYKGWKEFAIYYDRIISWDQIDLDNIKSINVGNGFEIRLGLKSEIKLSKKLRGEETVIANDKEIKLYVQENPADIIAIIWILARDAQMELKVAKQNVESPISNQFRSKPNSKGEPVLRDLLGTDYIYKAKESGVILTEERGRFKEILYNKNAKKLYLISEISKEHSKNVNSKFRSNADVPEDTTNVKEQFYGFQKGVELTFVKVTGKDLYALFFHGKDSKDSMVLHMNNGAFIKLFTNKLLAFFKAEGFTADFSMNDGMEDLMHGFSPSSMKSSYETKSKNNISNNGSYITKYMYFVLTDSDYVNGSEYRKSVCVSEIRSFKVDRNSNGVGDYPRNYKSPSVGGVTHKKITYKQLQSYDKFRSAAIKRFGDSDLGTGGRAYYRITPGGVNVPRLERFTKVDETLVIYEGNKFSDIEKQRDRHYYDAQEEVRKVNNKLRTSSASKDWKWKPGRVFFIRDF